MSSGKWQPSCLSLNVSTFIIPANKAADTLTPCVTQASAAMILTMHDKSLLFAMGKDFN